MEKNDLIVEWIVNKINDEYKDDVCLLMTYGSYINGTYSSKSDVDFYFIPKTKRAYELCNTFIVEGIGYDLFPMTWERIGEIADFKDDLTPLLADVKILYSHSEEDLEKFKSMQSILQFNLNNKPFMIKKAYDKVDKAFNDFREMIFEYDFGDVRYHAGSLIMHLSDAVAYANQSYFKRGFKKHIEDLNNMKYLPKDFMETYDAIVKNKDDRAIKETSFNLIRITKELIDEFSEQGGKVKGLNLYKLASFYEESLSTWNKIETYCDNNDYKMSFITGTCLQKELNKVTKENGLHKFDVMTSFDENDLIGFRENAMMLKEKFKNIILDNGYEIESYDTIEDFIGKN